MLNKTITNLQKQLSQIKKRADSVLASFTSSDTYVIQDSTGTVRDYKYFVYPYKNFTNTDPKDEQFIAEHLAAMVSTDIEYIVTFEADGIGISKLVSVILDKPLIVCKPHHYNQAVFSFVQKTGYFTRDMYCPKLIDGKKIAVIDCMVSTGGTIQGFLNSLKENIPATSVEGVYAVVNKLNYHDKNPFGDLRYRFLFNLKINEYGKVEAVVSDYFRETFWKGINSQIIKTSEKLAKISDQSRNKFKVGAILLDNESFEIVGYGYKEQLKHAEQVAIEQARKDGKLAGRDLSIYTTLEPCVSRTAKEQMPCADLIRETPSITWVVIGSRDANDHSNFNKGVEMLTKAHKHIISFDHHPSIPLNYSEELSRRKYFSDVVPVDWDKVALRYQKTVDNEFILEPLVLELLKAVVGRDSTVLDVGCGTGRLSFEISKNVKHVLGIDKSRNFIQDADRIYKNRNLSFSVADASKMPQIPDESFDAVVSNLVFLVVPTDELAVIISEVRRVLKSGGRLIFSTSHPCFEHQTINGIKRVESPDYNYFTKDDRYGVTLLDTKGESTVSFYYYHRTLGYLWHLLIANGFEVQQFIEPKPSATVLRKFPQLVGELEFPPFIIIDAKRC